MVVVEESFNSKLWRRINTRQLPVLPPQLYGKGAMLFPVSGNTSIALHPEFHGLPRKSGEASSQELPAVLIEHGQVDLYPNA